MSAYGTTGTNAILITLPAVRREVVEPAVQTEPDSARILPHVLPIAAMTAATPVRMPGRELQKAQKPEFARSSFCGICHGSR